MTRKSAGSITGRLILMLTLGTTVLWLVAAAFSSGILQHELNESFDRAEAETAHRLLPLATDSALDREEHSGEGVHEIHHFELNRDQGLVYQLRLPGGRLALKSDDAPATPLSEPATPGFRNEGQYRVYTLVDPDTQLTIQMGESIAHRGQAILSSTLTLFLPLLMLIPLSALVIFIAVRRGLRPLTTLQAEIAARDSANLTPLDIGRLPGELTPIATALDRLIERVRSALEAERQFAANSAHELRTPIAGALAQTQRLIQSTEDEHSRSEARKIETTLRRLADLAEKLMQLARADAGMAASAEPASILPVLNLVAADVRSRARPPRDILIEAPGEGASLAARINIDALAIVLRNLLDNAVAHSPPETPINVLVAADRTITVRNASSPISPEALARLRRRFERGATSASGSGLGLAIVETILSQVGGELTLRSPAAGGADGFEAVVRLPPV